MTVTVRYWAGAKAAAGMAEESYPDTPDLATLLAMVGDRHASGSLPGVLLRCSYLVDEVSPGSRSHDDVVLREGSVIEVLPPFAGG